MIQRIILGVFISGLALGNCSAMDVVEFQRSGLKATLLGEVLVEAQDGGLMMRTTDGRIWMLQPDEIKKRSTTSGEFNGMNPNAYGKQIIARLPESATPYRMLKSKDYVVVYNTSPAYANWVKSLCLRLKVGFGNYWKNKGVKLVDPDVPLGVIILSSKREFDQYAISTLGAVQGNALAYYNMQTNEVVMYDLTGTEQFRNSGRITSSRQLDQILQQPAAANMVATIVHESVHQISFNSGLQKRFGPCPFWVNEGLAMFFEVPDLKSKRGWNSIGKPNPVRIAQLKKMLTEDISQFFDAVIEGDQRFRDPEQLLNSYAESWALSYFLLKRMPDEYAAFLAEIREEPLLTEQTKAERIAQFEKHFGSVDQVKRDCFRFVLGG